ncbi:hypothetical protein ACPPVS_12515 [Cellulomonas sp. McL0617]|uniref:hypothetical protein n=1 Tax=Cellulomonas sp. McL0617 TaxID=3415675 RepID=UPI003CF52D41
MELVFMAGSEVCVRMKTSRFAERPSRDLPSTLDRRHEGAPDGEGRPMCVVDMPLVCGRPLVLAAAQARHRGSMSLAPLVRSIPGGFGDEAAFRILVAEPNEEDECVAPVCPARHSRSVATDHQFRPGRVRLVENRSGF